MGDTGLITIDAVTLRQLQKKAQRIMEPVVEYNSNTESFLKGVIADQQNNAADIDNMITTILFG